MSDAHADATVEQQAWRDLLDSPGWTRLVEHARAEYGGDMFAAQVERLADMPHDPDALSHLRQLLAAKRAVLRLLALPEAAIAKAKRHANDVEDAGTMSRRGRL